MMQTFIKSQIFSWSVRVVAALAGLLMVLPVRAVETDCLVRDPSTIIKRGDTYWVYGTGPGTQQFSSKDKIHWTNQGPALPKSPDWLAATVPGNKDNTVWAPDIHLYHGKYLLYSAYSTWGTSNSGIGLATSTNLDPHSWVEQGLVVHSENGGNVNDIDPCVFEDAAGALWLSYGSFWSGIKLIKLDPNTGLQAAGSAVTSISSNGEASYIAFHNGYYYLFVNWESCCQGSLSKYNIRVGRSQAVTGPYLDKSGKDMMQGAGTLFLGSVTDNGSGRPPDDEVGPGHVGILHDTDGDWLSTHYEWARDKNGATTVNVQRLAWDSDGWPRAVLDPGPYKITSFLSTHEVLTVAKNGAMQTMPDKNTDDQSWTLADKGDGYYSVLQGSAARALTAGDEPAKPGSKVGVAPFAGRDTQLWFLQQNDDGTYTLLAKSGGRTIALDIGNCSLVDGAGVGLWTSLGNDCQKWSFHRR